MADELNTNVDTPTFVDPNTDDLDAFNDLLSGRASMQPDKEDTKEDDKPAPKDVDSEADDDEVIENEDDSETPDGEEGEGDEPKPEDEQPKKKTNSYQERINELTAKAREAERREKEVLRRLDELAAKQSDNTEPTKQPAPKQDAGPTPDDQNEDGSDKYPLGEFDPSYIRDLTRHTIQAETAAANQRQEQERAERETTQAREELNTKWAEKLTTASTTHEDFMEKTIQLEDKFEGLDPGYSDYLVQTIKSLDHGPEVLYHFANNLAEADAFVKLGPLAATLALGEMNARFKKTGTVEEVKPKPKVSDAPPPPQVQNKGTKQRVSVAADTDDLDAFSRDFFAPKKRR